MVPLLGLELVPVMHRKDRFENFSLEESGISVKANCCKNVDGVRIVECR